MNVMGVMGVLRLVYRAKLGWSSDICGWFNQPLPWCRWCQVGSSNTVGSPLPQKRAQLQKSVTAIMIRLLYYPSGHTPWHLWARWPECRNGTPCLCHIVWCHCCMRMPTAFWGCLAERDVPRTKYIARWSQFHHGTLQWWRKRIQCSCNQSGSHSQTCWDDRRMKLKRKLFSGLVKFVE